jgi:hypothetical protein
MPQIVIIVEKNGELKTYNIKEYNKKTIQFFLCIL